jgi:5-bromo-4-chloroindolyl phosphate hydrolysis protein
MEKKVSEMSARELLRREARLIRESLEEAKEAEEDDFDN